MAKKYMKKKMDGWMDIKKKKRWMVGWMAKKIYEKKYGWLDG